MWNSLRTRLTIIFVGLAVGPLLVVGILLSQRSFAIEQDQAIELQNQVAQHVSAEVGSFIDDVKNNLTQIGNDIRNLGQPDRTQQLSLLLGALNSGPYRDVYEELSLLDTQGHETIRLSRDKIVSTNELKDLSAADDFNQPRASKDIYFSPVWFNQATGESLITIAIPLYPLRSVELSGVLVAHFRLQALRTLIGNMQLNADQTIYIEDPESRVVVQPGSSVVPSNTIFILPTTRGRIQGLTSKEDVLFATDSVTSGNLGLFIVAERPVAVALELAQNGLYIAILVTIFALVAAVGLVTLTVRQVVSPVEKLSTVARSIQKGDLSVRSDIKRQDEIGQLAISFNEMAEAIQKRETDLLEQAEALRIATAKAREAARVKGEFLANVSHELRTPLNAIIGFSDMLLVGMTGPLNDKQQHKMTRLKENGTRLLALINDLLDLTRIEAGRIEMVEKPFDPRQLAARMAAQMESLAVESQLQFETIISPDVPETILGDEKRIEQVVVNLLSNAFKFTKEGSVTLNMSANHAEQTWILSVADTGIGIPPHAINIIFEEFRQLDGSYSRAYKGSGLGLAITRNLARMMGGKISVKSEIGSGSTFTVVMPMIIQQTAHPIVLEAVAS